MTSRKDVRLVSFDGGGARAFSQLEIMGAIMHQLRWIQYPDELDRVMLPCEYFDLMGGNDTGGLIAILFAKLRMSVEEASDAFYEIFEAVYNVENMTPPERTKALKTCLETLLCTRGLPKDLKLVDNMREGLCAGFVLSSLAVNTGSKVCLRTYSVRSQTSSEITVVDALLATCAMQPIFGPVTSGTRYKKQEYVGVIASPLRDVISEAHSVFGGDSNVASLLSLGSGNPGGVLAGEGQTEANKVLQDIINDCERSAQEIQQQTSRLGVCFRFSVEQGMQTDRPISDISWIVAQTGVYLGDAATCDKLRVCANKLDARIGVISLDQLKYTGGQEAIYKGTPILATHYVKRHIPRNLILDGIRSTDSGQTVIVVTGIAGCGKTQLVTDIVRELNPERDSRFDYTFFIDGSSTTSIEADLIAHTTQTLPAGSQVDLKSAMSFFQNPRNSKWLLAFDNVDDVNLRLPLFLPQCDHGTVLVTSRNQSLGLLASPPHLHLKLDVMSTEEAIEVITRCSRRTLLSVGEAEALNKIAEALGYLPIALSQAGCYMAELACSGDEYLALLTEYRSDLLDRPSVGRQQDCVYATLDISYKRLPSHVQNLVHLMAFFHFVNFPLRMVTYAVKNSFRHDPFPFIMRGPEFDHSVQLLQSIFLPKGEWSNIALQEIVLTLQNYSLALFTSNQLTKLMRIHPLVRDWAYDRLTPERRTIFQDAALRLLISSMDDKLLEQYYLPHIKAIMLRTSPDDFTLNDRAAFGKLLRIQDQMISAQRIWSSIYNTLRQERGADHLDVATAALEASSTYSDSGLEQMEKLEIDAVRIRKLLLGPTHIATLRAMVWLSWTWERQGKHEKSQELGDETLKHLREKLPTADPDVWTAAEELAQLHARQRKFDYAEAIQIRVLEERRTHLGDTHLDTLEAMDNLGTTYNAQCRFSDAEALRFKVWEGRRKLLGDGHLDTLIAAHNLALTYYQQGRFSEAEHLQVKVLDEYKTHWVKKTKIPLQGRLSDAEAIGLMELETRRIKRGDEDPNTINAMHYLARTYFTQGRLVDAETLQAKVADARKAYLGEAHIESIDAMAILAKTWYMQGKHEQAKALQTKVLEARRAQFGYNDFETFIAMSDLALTYCSLGDLSEAESLQLKVVKRLKIQLGHNRIDTLLAMGQLARTFYQQRRYSTAEPFQKKVSDEFQVQLGGDHFETLGAMSSLATTYYSLNRYAEAEDLQLKVVARLQAKLGETHLDTLSAMTYLALTYTKLTRYLEAEVLHVKIVEGRKSRLGDEHAETITAMRNLASLYYQQGRYSDSEPLQHIILARYKTVFGDHKSETLSAMRDLASIYGRQGRYSDSLDIQLQLLEILKKKLGDGHPETLRTMSYLSRTYDKLGRTADADALREKELQLKCRKDEVVSIGDV